MSSRILQALWSGATTSPEGASGWLSLLVYEEMPRVCSSWTVSGMPGRTLSGHDEGQLGRRSRPSVRPLGCGK